MLHSAVIVTFISFCLPLNKINFKTPIVLNGINDTSGWKIYITRPDDPELSCYQNINTEWVCMEDYKFNYDCDDSY